MIYSMTAYAECEVEDEFGKASCEMRSVNHRYLDVNLRLPESLRELEMKLRDKARSLFRGKFECQLKFFPSENFAENFTFNHRLAGELASKATQMRAMLGQSASVNVSELLAWPGVLQSTDTDLTSVHPIILDLFEKTIAKLMEVRAREGKVLMQFIEERLEKISHVVELIRKRLPEVIAMQREKLVERLNLIKAELDGMRLEQEIVLFAQKIDVTEELDRLVAHVIEVKHIFTQGGAVGRQLDFLMQEFNREANTLASKSCDNKTTQAAVELKVLIEQMREQVQNIA